MPPSSLSATVINIAVAPVSPYLGWKLAVDDGTYHFKVIPWGNRWVQLAIFMIMLFMPVTTAAASVWAYMGSFYGVKFNEVGVSDKRSYLPIPLLKRFGRSGRERPTLAEFDHPDVSSDALALEAGGGKRRTVLIATMEYDIEDWAIKIKIGGLGVMAQLMGKNLGFQDLIWVVPCVGGIDYPTDEIAEPMYITILGALYEVQVQYHKLRNITYVSIPDLITSGARLKLTISGFA
jgi:alpha-1,3-glucan synthase